MATTRICSRLLRGNVKLFQGTQRCVNTQAKGKGGQRFAQAFLLGAVSAGGAAAGYTMWLKSNQTADSGPIPKAFAASKVPDFQPTVISEVKKHALYLTIHLNRNADHKKCAQVAANLQKYVDKVCPADLKDEENEVFAGVGFAHQFYERVLGKPRQSYLYPHRRGKLGDMPSTGGDIFIHAKSDETSKLFELTQELMRQFPPGSVAKYEDIYSFVYRNGRDLSGFIDGTENPADDEHRTEVAVEKETGGSYVITQKWIHNLPLIDREKDSVMEGWIGRTRDDSVELKNKPASSHVARMTGGANFEQKKEFEIVRQSMPYGQVNGEAGLFFIGYSASPKNLEFMLDQMVGNAKDGLCDDVMRLTRCVTGNYFYFPGVKQLKQLA